MPELIEVFNRYRERGGEELIADRMLESLREATTVASVRWDSRDWDGGDAPGPLGQMRRLFHNPDSAADLRAAVDTDTRAILAHNPYPVGSPSVYREARRLGIPLLQFTHNFRPFSVNGTLWDGKRVEPSGLLGKFGPEVRAGAWQNSVPKSALFALMLRSQSLSGALGGVTRWIAISDFMRRKFIEAGLQPHRVITLRHFWRPLDPPPDPEDDGGYLFLGRLVPEKGVAVLLDAWRRLEASRGSRCPILRIGGTGPLESDVRKAAARSNRIEYLGYLDGSAKTANIRRCRAMLAPSVWWEPLGLVTYEAYDHGKPMLAAASGGLTETVGDGETGFLHAPGDAHALAASVARMDDLDSDTRRDMGAAGRAWLREEASEARWKARLFTIIDEVARERARPL